MKFAILGGSFNPIHLGHLFLADAVLSYGYDRIILIPAFQSPFKIGAKGASPADRLDMLCASITADHRITVDECEIRREGVSYTIDTIADIKKRYLPEGKPGLVLGDDLADTFHLWRDASIISAEADIIIARRLSDTGVSADGKSGFAETADQKSNFPFPHRCLNNPVLDISSRFIRDAIQTGKSWKYLVPAGARHIIEDRGLYGCKTFLTETLAFLENAVRMTLDTTRFIHSRNTALFAQDLCMRFGLDPQAGYLAGITHDLCKTMDDDALISAAESDGMPVTKQEKMNPQLLHGRAAAVVLRSRYNISDPQIIEALQYHVTGGPGTGPLAKILYIADKIEVSRTWVATEYREMCQNAGLDEIYTTVLNYTVSNLESRNIEPANTWNNP